MNSYHILSWNVLYRPHEERYHPNSIILKKFPVESDRMLKIIEFLSDKIQENTILCLQESSVELNNLLETNFSSKTRIFLSFKVDDNESLFIMAPSDFKLEFSGKLLSARGCQIISNKTTKVVNCHLTPEKFSSISPVKFIQFLDFDIKKTLIICGDFNHEHKFLKQSLIDTNFICPFFGKTYKNKSIDHILIRSPIILYNQIHYPRLFLSDHDMIGVFVEINENNLSF